RDGIEVAQYLCPTQYKKKVIVLGHSWGSIVAVNMVRQRPDLFAAYVGTGQVASWAASVRGQFALLFRKARADNDQDSIRMFETIGEPDPANAKQYFGFTKNLRAAMAPSDQAWLEGLRTQIPKHFGGSEKDFEDFLKGMDFSAKHVLPDQMATDLPATASRINIPFFVIQGRDDVIT